MWHNDHVFEKQITVNIEGGQRVRIKPAQTLHRRLYFSSHRRWYTLFHLFVRRIHKVQKLLPRLFLRQILFRLVDLHFDLFACNRGTPFFLSIRIIFFPAFPFLLAFLFVMLFAASVTVFAVFVAATPVAVFVMVTMFLLFAMMFLCLLFSLLALAFLLGMVI